MGASFLVTIHRKDQTLTREVSADSFSVGRSVECDLPLSDSQISRVHLTVSRHGNELYIEDKNSSNGTFINENRITPGVVVAVNPTDRIQLGRSEYTLYLELKLEPQAQPEPEPEEEPELEPTMAMVAPVLPPQQAEKLLQEAKRQAAQIVLEGETQAEKRVQAIYQKAREDQAQAEKQYNTKISEANKEADQILEDAKKQGQSLLHEARRMSQELREEVDHYVQSLREKGKKEAETLHSEATAQADKVRAEAFSQSRLEAKDEAEKIVKTAKEEAERLMEFTQMQAAEIEAQHKTNSEELKKVTEELTSQSAELERVVTEVQQATEKEIALKEKISTEEERLEKALTDEQARVEALLKEERETLDRYLQEKEESSKKIIQEQEERVAAALQQEETRVLELLEKEESRVAEILQREESRVAEILEQERTQIADLKRQETDLRKDKAALETDISSLQMRQGKVVADLNDLENRFALLAKDYEAEKIKYSEKIANEFATQKKNAEDKRNTFELELNRRLQELEKKMLDEVLGKKDDLVKNLHTAIEQQLINAVDPERWPFVSNKLGVIISEAVEGKVATMAQETSSIKSLDKLVAQKRNEKYRMLAFGVACGLAIFFCGQLVYQRISADQNPLQTMSQQAAQKRQEDLEARKFNPPQTDEVRETYTDSVIYTRNFVDIYTEPVFQEKLYKAASQYLLKTWRVDEDKSIQVLAASSALVKDLADRRTKIHPDYIKEGIDKMRASEKELLGRLRGILGTDVRVESFRRFERNFYAEELKNRRMAGQR